LLQITFIGVANYAIEFFLPRRIPYHEFDGLSLEINLLRHEFAADSVSDVIHKILVDVSHDY
jgi:hypothetical protein